MGRGLGRGLWGNFVGGGLPRVQRQGNQLSSGQLVLDACFFSSRVRAGPVSIDVISDEHVQVYQVLNRVEMPGSHVPRRLSLGASLCRTLLC